VYELILAFSELAPQAPEFRLHIGGGPHPQHLDYYEAIKTLVKKLGLQERVLFYGPVAEPSHWYPNIDIFISNSYSEGLQVAPIEAMSTGRFCLSHAWSGAEELLPDAYLFTTERELLQKIMEYHQAPESVKKARQEQMRATVCEKFNIHRTKAQIRDLIEAAYKSPVSMETTQTA